MERIEIDKALTWDLETMYSTFDDANKDLEIARQQIDALVKLQGQFTVDAHALFNFLEMQTQMDLKLNKVYVFGYMSSCVTPNDIQVQEIYSKALNLISYGQSQLKFAELEMLRDSELILSYINDPILKDYAYVINNILRVKPHMASDEVEQVLANMSSIRQNAYETFSLMRVEPKGVMVDGKEEFLNEGTLHSFLTNPNQSVRKEAYENFYAEYKRFANVFGSTLKGTIEGDCFVAKTKKFNSALEASLFEDNAPVELFDKILYKANEQYRSYLHDYFEVRKKVTGLEHQMNYDIFVPLVSNLDLQYSIDESFELIVESVKPFGTAYQDLIRSAKKQRWVDFLPHANKRGGAYSYGCYDSYPFILTNYTGDYDSLSTLAHELGHSCHSYYSNSNQKPQNANYRIFVAEVASIVNETLLINLMLEKAKTVEEKRYLQASLLEHCVGTMYRQPLYAQFERTLHEMVENNEALSVGAITSIWTDLNKAYFGESVELSEYATYGCFAIPHFYYNFYVYKYTLGIVSALTIVSRILKGDQQQVERYLNFLKSGGSKDPIDLLKEAGVDPLDDAMYDEAFNYFNDVLQEFKKNI